MTCLHRHNSIDTALYTLSSKEVGLAADAPDITIAITYSNLCPLSAHPRLSAQEAM